MGIAEFDSLMGVPNLQRPTRMPRKVGDIVARELVNTIVRDGLKPGTVLSNDAQLARQFGVGRASVREALRILESFGAVRLKTGPGGGPIVAETDGRTFAQVATLFFQLQAATGDDILQARIALEPMVARLAATSPEQDKRDLLARMIQQLAQLEDDDPLSQYFHGLDFHHLLLRCAGNPVIEMFGEALNEVIRRISPFNPRYESAKVRAEHLAIVEAIARGDSEAAAAAATHHALEVRDFLRTTQPELLAKQIVWS